MTLILTLPLLNSFTLSIPHFFKHKCVRTIAAKVKTEKKHKLDDLLPPFYPLLHPYSFLTLIRDGECCVVVCPCNLQYFCVKGLLLLPAQGVTSH